MIPQLITIEKATLGCLDRVLEILSDVNLPHDGVKEHLDGFLIARNSEGRILGCVGLERYGEFALLRSAAVLSEYQRQRIGNSLISAILKHAASEGITEVALLTTTAKDYFQNKFGFREAKRSRYEGLLASSPEWNLPRCSSAALLTLKLEPRAHPA